MIHFAGFQQIQVAVLIRRNVDAGFPFLMPLAEVHVTLKPALFDAQGETIKKALHQLGYTDVQSVRIGKLITVELSGDEGAALQGQLDLMCRQILANPVIEDYEITTDGADPIAIADATAIPLSPGVPATGNSVATDLPGQAHLQPAHAEGVMTSRQAVSNSAAATAAAGLEAVSTPGGVTDPFQVDFGSYEAMATEAKQSLRILALRKYGNWIESQLRARSASWILCLGQNVVEHGNDIENAPTDQHLLDLGIKHDRVPWVFNRPQA